MKLPEAIEKDRHFKLGPHCGIAYIPKCNHDDVDASEYWYVVYFDNRPSCKFRSNEDCLFLGEIYGKGKSMVEAFCRMIKNNPLSKNPLLVD